MLGDKKPLIKRRVKTSPFFFPVTCWIHVLLMLFNAQPYIVQSLLFAYSGLFHLSLVSRDGEGIVWRWGDWKNPQWELCLYKGGQRGEAWCGQSLHDICAGLDQKNLCVVDAITYKVSCIIEIRWMLSAQATSGGGGWPMSVWLTPDLKPFIGGTYFPPRESGRRPGLKTVLLRIIEQVGAKI